MKSCAHDDQSPLPAALLVCPDVDPRGRGRARARGLARGRRRGQRRALRRARGFELSGGRITQSYDGFVKTDTFRTGSDADGAWIEIGAGRHRPLAPPAAKGLVGTWSGAGGRYVFRADGTYESGHVSASSELTIAAGGRGTYVLDGYLLSLRPGDGPGWITTIGASGAACLVIGPTLYCRD